MELEIIFNRMLLRLGYVSIEDFVKYASKVQEIVSIIGQARDPRLGKKYFRLLIKEQQKGSQRYILIPAMQTITFGETPVSIAVEDFHEIVNILEEDHEGSNHLLIKKRVKNMELRNQLINDLRAISQRPGSFSIKLKKTAESDAINIFSPKKKYKKSIQIWKKLEQTKSEEEFLGALTIMHGEGTLYVRIRDKSGESIKYQITESELDKYSKYFMKIIKVRGLYNPIQKKLETIEELDVIESLPFKRLKDITFKKPLLLFLGFKSDAFFMINKELNIIAAGKTFRELKNDLYECVNTHIEFFIDTDKELSPEAEEIKKNLLDLIDIDRWRRTQNGKFR